MAFNIQTFKTRALTAIVFALIMLCGIFINPWSFFLLFSVIHFGCWLEFQKISAKISPDYKYISLFHRYGVMLAGFGFVLWSSNKALNLSGIKLDNIGYYLMLVILIVLPLNEFIFSKHFSFKNLFISAAGLLYISLSCGLMVNMRMQGIIPGGIFTLDFGLILPIVIITTIWINDTMAYIVGSFIGKTQLSHISPKKTWEGTIGGALLAITIVTICGYFFFKTDVTQLIIITLLTCAAGVVGDLFESKLKRMAGVKDSGNIMPGHGGFLDRFDSLLFAIVFVWMYVQLFL